MGGGKSKLKGDKEVTKMEVKTSKEIDNALTQDRTKDSEVIKLLLLGAGESGKSTLFKQMIKLYGNGFQEKDLLMYVPMIHNNTITSMKELCFQTGRLGADDSSFLVTSDAALASKAFLDEVKAEDKLTMEIAQHIHTLWQDPGIQKTFDNRARFQLVDSADYFFNDIFRLASPHFMPTDGDLIHCRVRTTGIVEMRFSIDNSQFLIVDVGGQRNERKKWIHCFEGVTAVIFVVDASEYDKVLFEDGQTNRMQEALKLFAETVILKWFVRTEFVLFLNKRDLFAEKIRKVPLRVGFPEYDGPNTEDASMDFIRMQFEKRYPHERLYCHVTCATDSNQVRAVFEAVKEIVIRGHLRATGLL